MQNQDCYSPQLRVPCHDVVVASSQDDFLQILSGTSVLPLQHFGTDLLLSVSQEGGQHDSKDEGGQQDHDAHQKDGALPRPGRALLEGHPARAG